MKRDYHRILHELRHPSVRKERKEPKAARTTPRTPNLAAMVRMTPEDQVDRTLALWLSRGSGDAIDKDGEILDEDGRFFGVIQRKVHLFLPGDIVIGFFNNGAGERWPVYARSSRGFNVVRYYIDFFRTARHITDNVYTSHSDRTQGRILVTPDPLKASPSWDPALRAWLVSEASRVRRTSVSADSGDSSPTSPPER